MNNFLQENLLAIVLFLLLIILLLIALIGTILIKLLMSSKNDAFKKDGQTTEKETSVVLVPKVEVLSKIDKLAEEEVEEKYFCEKHPTIPSVGACLICEDVFCEQCLIEHDGLYFCKEHFKTFANNKWKQITDVKTTPSTPEDGLFIYHFKRQKWQSEKAPMFILTHYKINIEEDFIESFIQLNVMENDAEKLQMEIENFKV